MKFRQTCFRTFYRARLFLSVLSSLISPYFETEIIRLTTHSFYHVVVFAMSTMRPRKFSLMELQVLPPEKGRRSSSAQYLPSPESIERSKNAARRLSASISESAITALRRTSLTVRNNVSIILLPTIDEVFERERTELHDADDLLRLLGNPGRFQLIQYMLLCLQFLAYMSDFSPVFFNLQPLGITYPNRSLLDDGGEQEFGGNTTVMFVPFAQLKSARSCQGFGLDSSNLPLGLQYVYPVAGQRSIIADMNLICGRMWIPSFGTVIYFLGHILISPFTGWVADSYGRRPLLLGSNLMCTLLCIGIVFSRDHISYLILRFFHGVFRQGMNSAFWVLIMEWAPPQRRATWATSAWMFFAFTLVIEGVAALLLPNWHHLQIFITCANVFAVPLIWFAPESLKWLLLRNRPQEILQICQQIAKFNRINDLPADLGDTLDKMAKKYDETQRKVGNYTLADCFRTPYIRMATFLCYSISLTNTLAYFAMTLILSEIFGDVYINFIVSGVLEFVPRIVALGCTFRLTNRTAFAICVLISSVLTVVSGLIPIVPVAAAITQTVFVQIARMCLSGAASLNYAMTSELYPTVIRNLGYSVMSVGLRTGFMLAPAVAALVCPGN
ncbi:hypothetical protein RvY_19069-2 [Ramazzottius varieornatus]|uniref:Major facilitator superfamily (MFS) profile domain-containing protein n=1 Tax=Ramazzottius varieornatus TaxID=947166 RepID=A0A1D1W8A0_RAMVA|nr:hypothetical protein RvY_19069-2 [Ramazzottius varieornatus]